MSGDVQPRKRKDKKRKKDELGVEEPRGTAAALGEGDVFLHASHDHGTGGHWCAKIIFFFLLAVLLALIGLIILENRGLSELEANAVESRYSGILEGWLEDAPDDDHHDAHTLDLKHHDDDEDEHSDVAGHDDDIDHYDDEDEDEHGDEDENEHGDEGNHSAEDEDDDEDDNEEETNEDSQEQDVEQDDDEDEDTGYSFNKYFGGGDDDEENEDDDDQEKENEDEQENINTEEDREDSEEDNNEIEENNSDDENNDDVEENEDQSVETYDNDNERDENQNDLEDEQNNNDEDDEEHEEEEHENTEIEVERIEREASEEEPISSELPALLEADDDDDDGDKEQDKEESDEDEDVDEDDGDVEEDEFLEADEDEPVVERITPPPAGKPFVEVEDEVSSEQPPDTLEEEEEYEKQQEELRREEEQASHMWLKLGVGGALLLATHAVVRRFTTAPARDVSNEERVTREDSPAIDRRMTLIPEEPSEPVAPKKYHPSSRPVVEEEIVSKPSSFVKSAPAPLSVSEDEDQEEIDEVEEEIEEPKIEDEKELFSDEEEAEEDVEEIVEVKKESPKQTPVEKKAPEPDEDVPDDVEIIDEEQLEEELEDEDDDEEISDVDDAELLTRLEAKYGRLPEPERPGQKHKDGGNSIEDEWPGEPSDAFWRQEVDSAEQQLNQGEYLAAAERARAPELSDSGRARWLAAAALDRAADARRDNRLLSQAITAYLHLLKMNERLSDKKLVEIAERTLDRIQFRGNYLNAEPVYRLLIRRFPNDPAYRNNLTVSFLMANRVDLAEEVLRETLRRWPDDRVALAHYGFVLKTQHNRLEDAVKAFQKALEGDQGPACEPRFYYHYGDALLLLGRYKEANDVHERGAKLGHFLSPAQRSLYNVPRLKSRPWWNVAETPYANLARSLEKSWREILREGEAARAQYEKEKEGLKESGDWSQLDLFVRGSEIAGRCKTAPVTCAVVKGVGGCRRGQVKFSAMEPGTHVRPHVGPTNCRLRMHLGLSNTTNTYLRVDKETRTWQEGKVLMFDDSFEHEVWHNGTGTRLVLIVDVWHPDLTPAERRQLPAI